MAQLLLYEDARALSAYLAGAALLDPALPEQRCVHLELSQGRRGLLFVEGAELPSDHSRATQLVEAELRGGRVHWGEQSVPAGPACPLAQAVPPLRSTGAPPPSELLFLVQPGPVFARLVTQHLELGIDDLRYAAVQTPSGERIALEVPRPSWFLLERWAADHAHEAQIYRRLSGPMGPRSTYVAWGHEHALEAWLREPSDDQQLLLIDADGFHQTLTRGALREVGEVLRLDPRELPTAELTPAAAPALLSVRLRLEGRTTPRDPELWLLPAGEQGQLEELLTQLPEEELKNLLVACVEAPDGERLLCVREVITGRGARHLSQGKRVYGAVEGLPDLLVPCAQTLAPVLHHDRYAKAFGTRPGMLTVLDRHADAESPSAISVLQIPKAAFDRVERLIDFVWDGHTQELSAALLASPFDLGEFEELDLVPPGQPAKLKPAPKTPEPKPAPEPKPEPGKQQRATLLTRLMRPFQRPAPSSGEVQAPSPEEDPRRREVSALQRELALSAPEPAHWLRLGQLSFELEEPSEGVFAFEQGLWLLQGEEARAAEEELARVVGAPSRAPATSTRELYARVLAYRVEVGRRGNDADVYRALTEAAYELLRSEEERLRKKSRWLLWRAVLQETGDVIEAERQREAILSGLVLRGVEEREVPGFVRKILLEVHGQQAAAGSRAQGALSFLKAAETFAASLPHPAVQAVVLAHVAWALAELGQGERAAQLAKRCQDLAGSRSGTPPFLSWRGEALARVGSVQDRALGRAAGRATLAQSLNTIREELRAHPQPRDADGTRARKALVAWLGVVVELWGSEASGDELLAEALNALRELGLTVRSNVLQQARAHLEGLGVGAQARALLADLLEPRRLGEARRAFQEISAGPTTGSSALDSYRTHVQNAMTALGEAGQGAGFSAEEAQRIVTMFQEEPELVDEFAIEPFLQALRALGTDPWEVTEQTAARLRAGDHLYAARLLTIAGLRRLAELHDRGRGPDLLEAAIREAWLQEGERGKFRIRLVTRLVELIPAFGMRERGLRLLASVQDTVAGRSEDDIYCRNEMLIATTVAASKLGDSQASFDLVERAARAAMEEFNRSEDGRTTRHLLFETLGQCVRAAGDLGDARRGLTLLGEVAALAERAISESEPNDLARFFYCQTLIDCGSAAMSLGDASGAAALFASAIERVQSLSPFDQKDLLAAAGHTACRLEGDQRYQLATTVLQAAQPIASKGNLHNVFAMQLVEHLVREMVKGEGAFANALKRWKAQEERAIRDRVAFEEFAPS